jgi:hypothetical protein
MIENSINFVEKYENPANVPECRPIERFWAIFKQKLYQGNTRAANLGELERRVRLILKKIDKNQLRSLIDGIRPKLRYVCGAWSH